VDNKLAPGAKIMIRRSGDVIPAVEKVIEAAKEAKMPSAHPWKWLDNDCTAAHIILDKNKITETPKEVYQAKLVLFAKTFELTGLGPGIAAKLVNGGIMTPAKLITAQQSELVNCIGTANGQKLYTQLQCLDSKVTESKLMVASSLLPRGVGETKLAILFQTQPDPRNWHQLPDLAGWTTDSIQEVLRSLPAYVKYRNEEMSKWPYPILPASTKTTNATTPTTTPQKGTVCFTGVRSKELEAKLTAAGWKVVDTVSSKLSLLVVPDNDVSETGKVKKARDLNVRILPISQVEKNLSL
jgi:NAD-dependent DNA ligase